MAFYLFRNLKEDFIIYTLDLLSSHLLLAVNDPTCTQAILGNEGETFMSLLLNMIDEANVPNKIMSKIESTLQIGAQFLLPRPEQRTEMLLAKLPRNSGDLEKVSTGQVIEL